MEYTIRKRSDECAGCGRAFTVGESLYSVIRMEPDEPARRDFCEACFTAQERDAAVEYAYWRTRKTAAGRARRVVDFNTLRDLFFRMVHQSGGEYRKLSYLLCLVLLRKRVLRLDEFVTEGGVDYLVVSARQLAEPLRVESPELLPPEMEELRDKLRTLLDIDFEGEGAPAAAGDDAGEDEAVPGG